MALNDAVKVEFNETIIKHPNTKRFPGGDSDDLIPNLRNPANLVPALDPAEPWQTKGGGG